MRMWLSGALPVGLLLASVLVSGAEPEGAPRSSAAVASARYKKHRDFASLERLVGQLHLGMSREQVKTLLGEPNYCPVREQGQCYYASDKKNVAGVPLALVVDFVVRYRGERPEEDNGLLQSFSFGPVAE